MIFFSCCRSLFLLSVFILTMHAGLRSSRGALLSRLRPMQCSTHMSVVIPRYEIPEHPTTPVCISEEGLRTSSSQWTSKEARPAFGTTSFCTRKSILDETRVSQRGGGEELIEIGPTSLTVYAHKDYSRLRDAFSGNLDSIEFKCRNSTILLIQFYMFSFILSSRHHPLSPRAYQHYASNFGSELGSAKRLFPRDGHYNSQNQVKKYETSRVRLRGK